MTPDSHAIDRIFAALPEMEKREILRAAGVTDDRPNTLKGQGYYSESASWMESRRKLLAYPLLRTINLTDAQISSLISEGDFSIGEVTSDSTQDINIRVSITSTSDDNIDIPQDAVVMTDLAATSAIMCEMFVAISIANRPFGIDIAPPRVQVKRGSIEFAIGGGTFATGMALIVACGAGLVAAPIIGPLAGITIASVGILDLAVGWKKQVADSQIIDAQRREIELNIKLKELELEKARSQIQDRSDFAYSSLVDRSTVQSMATQLGITEGYANHVLNRSLPKYLALKQYTQAITVESASLSNNRKTLSKKRR